MHLDLLIHHLFVYSHIGLAVAICLGLGRKMMVIYRFFLL